jgi:CRISPR-associated protein Csx17
MIYVHHLRGCNPTVLAHYLKALGVLRLIATQADPQVRGWWQDESFHLLTTLNREALLAFFTKKYAPTPLIAPWNGGSGFYPKDNKKGIQTISASTSPRFFPYREAITQAASMVVSRDESPKNEEKERLLSQCRRAWRGTVLEWLDAAVVIDEELSPAYPSLLGTGGNDGRLDFTNNFMQRLSELFDLTLEDAPPVKNCEKLVTAALFSDEPTPGLSNGAAIGQFFPGGAGGANSSSGFSGDSLVNPWDFILMLEGSICFGAALSRRLQSGALPQAAAPFAIRNTAIGFGTATQSEESTRGEQWLPLWSKAAHFSDVSALLAEGRCQQGTSPVRRPMEMALAIARHGTARGIQSFQRMAFLERNGQANLAIPVGRWAVSKDPHPHQGLVEEVSNWIERLEQKAHGDHAPARWQQVSRRCSEALLHVCRSNQTRYWRELFLSLGNAERALAVTADQARDAGLRPLPHLSSGWIDRISTGNAPLRIALAIADQCGQLPSKQLNWHDTVRHHWLSLDTSHGRFVHFAEHVSVGVIPDCADPRNWLSELIKRRAIMESPLISQNGHTVGLHDVAQFLSGSVDVGEIFDLIGPCLAIDRAQVAKLPCPDATAEDKGSLAVYGLIRLATMPLGIEISGSHIPIPCDYRVINAITAGSLHQAVKLASRRLRSSGLRPFIERAIGDKDQARQIAAALTFPINMRDASLLAYRLTKPTVSV